MKYRYSSKGLLQVFLVTTFLSFTLSLSAIAYPRKLSLTILAKDNQSYQSLIRDAEIEAEKAIKKIFIANPNLTNLTVFVNGENFGYEVPLLIVKVSSIDWKKNPQITPWAKYFDSSEILLGFVRYSPKYASRQTVNNISSNQKPNYPDENEPNFYR